MKKKLKSMVNSQTWVRFLVWVMGNGGRVGGGSRGLAKKFKNYLQSSTHP